MMERSRLNLTTYDLDTLRRLDDAQREIGAISDTLLRSRTSKLEQRKDFGRRLNAVKASLRTVQLELGYEV